MKKLLLVTFFAIAFATLTIGCKKDSKAVIPGKEISPIVGKWKYNYVDAHTPGVTIERRYIYTKGEYLQFNTDGTGKDLHTSFSYTIKDKTVSISYAEYTTDGVIHNAFVDIATIKELTGNKLTLQFDYTFTESNVVKGDIEDEHLVR
jgi:hypothetical protein